MNRYQKFCLMIPVFCLAEIKKTGMAEIKNYVVTVR